MKHPSRWRSLSVVLTYYMIYIHLESHLIIFLNFLINFLHISGYFSVKRALGFFYLTYQPMGAASYNDSIYKC